MTWRLSAVKIYNYLLQFTSW